MKAFEQITKKLELTFPTGLPGSNGACSMYYVPEVRPLDQYQINIVELEFRENMNE
jgi:hypothetical protein